MRLALRIIVLGVVCAIAACDTPRTLISIGDAGGDGSSGDSSGSDGNPGDAAEATDLASMCGGAEPVTLADWEHCYQRRWCEVLVNCGELNLYRDLDDCLANEDGIEGGELSSELFERARAIAAGTASLDTTAFTECLVETSPFRCSTAAHPPVCKRRFVGTIVDHQMCFNDVECKSPGADCKQPETCTDSCCAGTCEPKPRVGEHCDDLVDGCEPGIVCGTDETCVVGDIGAHCAKVFDCVPGAWCNNGTCVAARKEGEPCDVRVECDGETSCVGLIRTSVPATCRRITHEGDACDWYCLGNLYCDTPDGLGLGTCKAIPEHGDSCSATLPCLGTDQVCGSNHTCVDRSPPGTPCVDGQCQLGSFCSDQLGATKPVCTARLADGESSCNQPSQCQSYVCGGDANASGSCRALQATCP